LPPPSPELVVRGHGKRAKNFKKRQLGHLNDYQDDIEPLSNHYQKDMPSTTTIVAAINLPGHFSKL
jgi:hypothetical protein